MKKFSILALVLVLTATLFTACTGTMTDETTDPSGSTGNDDGKMGPAMPGMD